MATTMQAPARITGDMLRAQYARNAADLAEMVEAARVATNAGEGGRNGKRYRGYFFHQIVAMHANRVESSRKTDAELAPVLAMLNSAFGTSEGR